MRGMWSHWRSSVACTLVLALPSGCGGNTASILSPGAAGAAIIRVGPEHEVKSPSAAARIARDGDVVEIAATTYSGDVAVWRANRLTLRGVGGRPHLQAAGASAEGKAIWVIKGAHTRVENIEFSGARVPDRNGAGIRQEGPGLTVRDCVFRDNENGILAGRNLDSEIHIEGTEFANNGHGDGYSHNLYIGEVKRLTMRASYSHHARVGHTLKSRARESFVLYNRIVNGPDGTASYEIDLPNGGAAYVIGNVVQQGPQAENGTLLSYGGEGLGRGPNALFLINNTFVNDRPGGGRFLFVAPGTPEVMILNNVFAGRGTVLVGPGDIARNILTTAPGFVDRSGGDYRLQLDSPAIDRGVPPGRGHGIDLAPVAEYLDRCRERPRPHAGALDAGAYERAE